MEGVGRHHRGHGAFPTGLSLPGQVMTILLITWQIGWSLQTFAVCFLKPQEQGTITLLVRILLVHVAMVTGLQHCMPSLCVAHDRQGAKTIATFMMQIRNAMSVEDQVVMQRLLPLAFRSIRSCVPVVSITDVGIVRQSQFW